MRWIAVVRALGAVVAVVAASGCDLVFAPGHGPGGSTTIDAPPADDADDADAPVDADASGLCAQLTPQYRHLDALADADISVSRGTVNTGMMPVAEIDDDLITYALVKFNVTGLPPGPPVLITLTLHYAENACAPGCSSCDTGEVGGALLAQALVSDWPEDEVTWEHTGIGGRLWNGASGLDDHSASSATAVHEPKMTTRFSMMDDQAFEFWAFADQPAAPGRLSFIVKPNAGTKMRVAAKEGETQCSMIPRAALDLVFCQ